MIKKIRAQARKNESEKDPLYVWGLLLEPAEKICQLKVEEGEGSSNPRLLKDVTQLTSDHTSYVWIRVPCSPLLDICQSYSQDGIFLPFPLSMGEVLLS